MTLTIKTDLLAAIARWASEDETRLHIARVLFDEDEIVATDGHRLVRYQFNCEGQTFCVSRGHVLAACAAQDMLARHASDWAVRLGTDLEAGSDGDTVLTAGGMRTIEIRWDGADGVVFGLGVGGATYHCGASRADDYPPIDQVMCTPRDTGTPWGRGFNIRFLAAIDDVVRAAGLAHEGTAIEGWAGDAKNLGPFQFASPCGGSPEVRFVIMPMRELESGRKKPPRE